MQYIESVSDRPLHAICTFLDQLCVVTHMKSFGRYILIDLTVNVFYVVTTGTTDVFLIGPR